MAGIIVGAGSVEIAHRSLDTKSKVSFARKLKCRSLANAYLQENSELSPIIASVDYSQARNSCVAALNEIMRGQEPTQIYTVRDVISQEILFTSGCTMNKDFAACASQMSKERDDAYQKALAGK